MFFADMAGIHRTLGLRGTRLKTTDLVRVYL